MKYKLAILLASALSLSPLFAQNQPAAQPAQTSSAPAFLVADGSSSGTYAQALGEIKSVTGDIINFQEDKTAHGAVDNLELLINNKVSGAFLHSDVIWFRSQSKDLSKYKTLIALFSEEVHFLALTNSKLTTGGNFMGMGKQVINVNTIEDLKGLKVGAAGGGYITAQVIRLQSQIAYDIVKYNKGDEVIAALNNGEIAAAVFVGGAPLPNLQDLGPEYKILSIPDARVQMLKAVYKPASVTYAKMRPEAVPTVAADCLFVAREYTKTPRLINLLSSFRSTFFERLGELQETPGFHPKWQEVSEKEHGKWPWMELPEAPAAY